MSKKTELQIQQEIWYAKLKAEGFKDLESAYDQDGLLKNRFKKDQHDLPAVVKDAIESYYRMAYHFLNEYKFETQLDRVIWGYHADGISVRKITKLLGDVSVQTSKSTIGLKIKHLRNVMKSIYLIP